MNLCVSCHQDFGSVSAFDAHRVGTHEYTFIEGLNMNPPREDGRRCLDLGELEGSLRFIRNARGSWSLATQLERARNETLKPAA